MSLTSTKQGLTACIESLRSDSRILLVHLLPKLAAARAKQPYPHTESQIAQGRAYTYAFTFQ
jgi:hypothetical protein